MTFLLFLLLVILVFLVIRLNLISECIKLFTGGVITDYKLPFIPTDLKSKEFVDFTKDSTVMTKIHAFLQKSRPEVLRYMINDTSVDVLGDICSDQAYNKLIKSFESGITKAEQDNDIDKANRARNELLNVKEIQTKSLEDLQKYNKKSGRVIQPATVLAGDSTLMTGVHLHATATLTDYKNEMIVYIDPHFNGITPESYTNFLNIREKIIKAAPELANFWYGKITDTVKISATCPIFQGSFNEKGLCPLWSTYLLALFAINEGPKYSNIVRNHERNPEWTQRNLQQFVYNAYKKFKNQIDKIDLEDYPIYDITGKAAIYTVRGKYNCLSHGWLWSDKLNKCFETQKEKDRKECESINNIIFESKCWVGKELKQHIQDTLNNINSSNVSDEEKEAVKDQLKIRLSGVMPPNIRESLEGW